MSITIFNLLMYYAYIFIHTQKETEIEVYDEEVAYVVMKAEKSCDLPYASQEIQESQWYNSVKVQRPEKQRSP